MTRPDHNLIRVLEHWFDAQDARVLQIFEIPAGLSGAKLWRVALRNCSFCLRRWPEIHPAVGELKRIHSLLAHIWSEGLRIVPRPRQTREGQTFVCLDARLWELVDWLPGEISEQPSVEQTAAAMRTLAIFHQHSVSYVPRQLGMAPGLQKRSLLLTQLQDGLLDQISQAVATSQPGEIRELAMMVGIDIGALLPSTLNIVQRTAPVALPLQWCLRDVHRGNLLFVGDVVTGLVDFGGATVDSVVGDIARLLRSLVRGDSEACQLGLSSYEKVRELSLAERQSIRAYDEGGLVIAAANWLRWRFVEGREFADAANTQSRLQELATQLKLLRAGGDRQF